MDLVIDPIDITGDVPKQAYGFITGYDTEIPIEQIRTCAEHSCRWLSQISTAFIPSPISASSFLSAADLSIDASHSTCIFSISWFAVRAFS